jgi:chromosome segregation ATPase
MNDQEREQPQRTSWKDYIYELDSDREHARDQLEAATVRTYQQMRTDQERIAEVELQNKRLGMQVIEFGERIAELEQERDQAKLREEEQFTKRGAALAELSQTRRELAEVQAQLWDYWKTYHDEHCTEDWPHTRDASCYYAPPPAARKRKPNNIGDIQKLEQKET